MKIVRAQHINKFALVIAISGMWQSNAAAEDNSVLATEVNSTTCVLLREEQVGRQRYQQLNEQVSNSNTSIREREAALNELESLLEGCDEFHLASVISTEEEIDLAKLTTTNDWMAVLESGAQLAPTYNDMGRSSGFEDQSLFLALRLDGRSKVSRFDAINRYGFDIEFRQAPIVNQAGNLENDTDQTVMMDTISQGMETSFRTQLTSVSFTDVDDTVDASLYYSPSFIVGGGGDCKGKNSRDHLECINFGGLLTTLGPVFRAGVNTRTDLIAIEPNEGEGDMNPVTFKDDSVVTYYGLGIRLDVEDFPVHKRPGARNGVRRGFLEIGYHEFEDYAGKEDVGRWVIDAQYRLFEDLPVFFGVHANLGEEFDNDVDDVSISISYQFSADDLLRRITP